MSDLELRVQQFAVAVGLDMKARIEFGGLLSDLQTDTQANVVASINELVAKRGDLTLLTTSATTSIVDALNSLQTGVAAAGDMYKADNLVGLGDIAVARTNIDVQSSQEVTDAITLAINNLIDNAPDAYNTFLELANEITANDGDLAALTTATANKVSFAAVQTLTAAEKLQACSNIGIGDPDHDYVTDYTTSRDGV